MCSDGYYSRDQDILGYYSREQDILDCDILVMNCRPMLMTGQQIIAPLFWDM